MGLVRDHGQADHRERRERPRIGQQKVSERDVTRRLSAVCNDVQPQLSGTDRPLSTLRISTDNEEVPSPSPALIELSQWFNHLSVDDQRLAVRAMTKAVDDALFGVMCLLDGVRSVNPRPGVLQHLELHAALEDGRRRQLNIDGEGEELHDLYGFLARDRGVPAAGDE
jgi:hypothetical protein